MGSFGQRQVDHRQLPGRIQMPQLDGIGATRAIRAIPGREHTPILSMTANEFAEDLERYREAGMNDHSGKPVDRELLFSTVLK